MNQNKNYEEWLDAAFEHVKNEVLRAKEKYPQNFNSPHEAYGVIYEELDELWDEIKAKDFDVSKAQKEAIQTAAMLFRFIIELTNDSDPKYVPTPKLITPAVVINIDSLVKDLHIIYPGGIQDLKAIVTKTLIEAVNEVGVKLQTETNETN